MAIFVVVVLVDVSNNNYQDFSLALVIVHILLFVRGAQYK